MIGPGIYLGDTYRTVLKVHPKLATTKWEDINVLCSDPAAADTVMLCFERMPTASGAPVGTARLMVAVYPPEQ